MKIITSTKGRPVDKDFSRRAWLYRKENLDKTRGGRLLDKNQKPSNPKKIPLVH